MERLLADLRRLRPESPPDTLTNPPFRPTVSGTCWVSKERVRQLQRDAERIVERTPLRTGLQRGGLDRTYELCRRPYSPVGRVLGYGAAGLNVELRRSGST